MTKCNCLKREYSENLSLTPLQKSAIKRMPCAAYDVEDTHDYFAKVLAFAYRNESIFDFTEQLGKCISYVLFHLETINDMAGEYSF
ncbi:hypothetical protein P4S60_01480 [Pseudoalteromonas sp. Hal040]